MANTLDFSSFWWELTIWENEDRFQRLSEGIIGSINQLLNNTKEKSINKHLESSSMEFADYCKRKTPIDPVQFFSHFEDFEKTCNNSNISILYT